MSGRNTGVVVRTADLTEIGRIAESLSEEPQEPPLVVRMRRFTRIIAVAIPAGLPVAVTAALAISANRMAERNVIVRRLPAVEGLGACTLTASDTTGTLIENKLAANRIGSADDVYVEVRGAGLDLSGGLSRGGEPIDLEQEAWLTDLAVTGALCSEGEVTVEDSGGPGERPDQGRDKSTGEEGQDETDEGVTAKGDTAKGDTVTSPSWCWRASSGWSGPRSSRRTPRPAGSRSSRSVGSARASTVTATPSSRTSKGRPRPWSRCARTSTLKPSLNERRRWRGPASGCSGWQPARSTRQLHKHRTPTLRASGSSARWA